MRFVFACAAAALALPSAAFADESWSFGATNVFWESDTPDGAVFAVHDTSGTDGRIFVRGLTADQTERGTYDAVWVAYDDAKPCDRPFTDPTGATTYDWGTMKITFTSAEFPYTWTGKMGACKGPQDHEITMEPARN